MSKVQMLPGAKLTPVVVLAEALDAVKDGEVKGVFVAKQWNDDTWTVTWSSMSIRDLVFAHRYAGVQIDKEIEKGIES